jgi:hypothetical protein
MIRMNWKETGFVTLNAAFLAIFYALLGVFVSYMLYHLFDSFDDTWKEDRSWAFKFADVSLEISILSIIAFWSAHVIELAPPFFPVRKELDTLVDGYISGIFYIFAIFVFMDELTEKLKYMFNELFAAPFSKYFPQHGSILDLSLSYTPLPRKTETKKDQTKEHQHGVSTFVDYR